MDDAKEIPLATTSFMSKLTFMWIQPVLLLGFRRPLVAEDLWAMDESRRAGASTHILRTAVLANVTYEQATLQISSRKTSSGDEARSRRGTSPSTTARWIRRGPGARGGKPGIE